MVLKSIVSKIQPITANEKCFCEAIAKTKSLEIDPRSLTFSFINESTLYPEAAALASSALLWAEELAANYSKFEQKAIRVAQMDENAFITYCMHKNWNAKRTSKDIIAREDMKFKARFELDSKRVYMVTENLSSLDLMKLVNDLEAASVLHK